MAYPVPFTNPLDFNSSVSISLQDLGTLVQYLGTALQASQNPHTILVVESVLFGVYTLLIVVSTFLNFRRGIRSRARALVGFVCIVMYTMSTTHWGLLIYGTSIEIALLPQDISIPFYCLTALSDLYGTCDLPVPDSTSSTFDLNSLGCPFTILLMINIVLSDGIVLWRALVIWGQRKGYVVRTISLILLLSTLFLSAVSAHTDSCNGPSEGFDEGFEDTYGLAAFIFSFLTNVWATSLISYKAWQHRQLIKNDLRGVSMQNQARTVLVLFVESGLLYCALWILLLIEVSLGGTLVIYSNPNTFENDWNFFYHIQLFKKSGLIQLIGIYPTAIVLTTALTKSYCERTLKYDSVVTPQITTSPQRIQSTMRQGPIVLPTIASWDVDVPESSMEEELSVSRPDMENNIEYSPK